MAEIHLRAGSSPLLFRKMLSQREWCRVDSRCWDKLVGLVVVGVESPMVEAVGVRKATSGLGRKDLKAHPVTCMSPEAPSGSSSP